VRDKKLIPVIVYSSFFFLLNIFFDTIVSKKLVTPDVYNFLFTLVEYLFFAALFGLGYRKNKTFVKTILICSVLFVGFDFFHFSTTKPGLIDSVAVGVSTLLIFFYIFYYIFLELRNEDKEASLASQYTFWVALGILIYLAGTFFFNLLIDLLPKEQIREYWFITYIFDIIKNIFFTIAIFVHIRQANKKPQIHAHKTNEPFLNFL